MSREADIIPNESQTMSDETPELDEVGGATTGEADDMEWYVLKVASNRERTIKKSLERMIKREGLEEDFGDIIIPTEKVVETKSGKKKIREVKLFPGYLIVRMRITDDAWYLVRSTTGVGDFTGAAGKPVPMSPEEVERLCGVKLEVNLDAETSAEDGKKEDAKDEKLLVKVPFEENERVKVKDGPFESFEGQIDSIDQHTGKIKILVEIFGRPTEVELEHWQVEKI